MKLFINADVASLEKKLRQSSIVLLFFLVAATGKKFALRAEKRKATDVLKLENIIIQNIARRGERS